MKVLLINNCHYRRGGSEAVYFNTAQLLREHGHEIVFFSISDSQNIQTGQKEYFIGQGGKLKRLTNYFYNKDAARELDEILTVENPDIVHAHLMWGGINQAIFHVLKKHKVPIVHTAHDYRMACPAYTFRDGAGNKCERCRRWNYYQCALHRCSKGDIVQSSLMALEMYTRQIFYNPLKNIDGFIFVSHFSEQKHIEHNPAFAKSKHIVLYNYTKPLLRYDQTKKDNYFLYFGRLSHEKGVPTLLKAIVRHPELKLKVVGTGPLEENLKREYVGSENIEFLGYRFGTELAELVRCAKFVCVPSECYENNPMTIVEAYSLGTPVIGARIGGIPEIIDEGRTGLQFDLGSVNDLERAILKVSSLNQEEYARMCHNAYDFYENNFSGESHYKELITFYESILNRNSKP